MKVTVIEMSSPIGVGNVMAINGDKVSIKRFIFSFALLYHKVIKAFS